MVKISNTNVTSMFYAADKYMLTTVKTKCFELLRSTATSVDAVVTLSTANQFHLEDLLKESLQYIEENTEICLSSSYAVELNNDCVQMILISEHLSCSETEVCKFFLKWIKTKCKLQGKEVNVKNRRSKAERLMQFIRFPLVENKYFSNKISHSKLLTNDEIISVYRYHYGETCSLFSDKPRCPRIPNNNGQTHSIYRHSTCSHTLQNVSPNALKFHLNRSIWLKGCIIFGPTSTNYANQEQKMFTFELNDDSENMVCWEVLNIGSGTPFNNTVALTIKKPVLLNAEKQYTIIVRDIKPQTYYGTNCKSVCIQDSVTITFENSPKSTAFTNVTQGQIAGIMYSI